MDFTKKIVYQVYPRSFKDSNNDGIGDIRGIISKLDYIQSLGVTTIWLSPVYSSPGFDNGYDISDYKGINPEFGTMEDMDELILQAKTRGIGIMMDMVINHTSNEHEWFINSKEKGSKYSDYYFWDRGDKKRKLPNNWTSFFGERAWSYDDEAKGFYLHLFSKQQPDLNYHNPEVLKEIKEILKFWLEKGVIGFRCDVINIIWKDSLSNGKKRLILKGIEHYLSKEGTHKILKELRKDVFSKYDCFTVGETVFVSTDMAKDLCAEERKELDMVFSFEHMETDQIFVKWFKTRFKPKKLFKVLSKWQKSLHWNANYFENHDQPRSVSRFISNPKYRKEGAKTLAMLLFCLRGTPYIYQGQEIGMTNFDISSIDDIQDVESKNIYALARKIGFPKKIAWKIIKRTSRDNARTPMQWNNKIEKQKKSWLKANSNCNFINVETQEKDEDSILSFYKRMINLRKENDILINGEYREIKISKSIYIFERFIKNSQKDNFHVVINLGSKPKKYAFDGKIFLSTKDKIVYDGVINPYEGIIFKS